MPRLIMVATSERAEWTALRASTMPIAPASAAGPRIQNATASPVETCAGLAAASMTASLSMVAPDLGRTSDDRLSRDVGFALRPTRLLPRRVVGLLVVAQAERMRWRLHPGQEWGHQLFLGVDQVLPV